MYSLCSYIKCSTTNGDPRFNVQRVKRVVGIPRDFLKTVSAPAAGRDKGILMTPDGGFAIMEPNEYVLFEYSHFFV